MDEKTICENIKKCRIRKQYTLEKLALLTGLTKGYLSKVERSDKAPPYSTLNKIAGALGMEVTGLLEKSKGPLNDMRIDFTRTKDAAVIRGKSKTEGYDYQILAGNKPGKNMEPFIIYAPDEIKKMYTHEGEEFLYVIEGRLEFIYGDQTYIMEPGDTVYFDSCVPHTGRSLGGGTTRLLVMIYFYKRNRL